jgi:hypothetical protein
MHIAVCMLPCETDGDCPQCYRVRVRLWSVWVIRWILLGDSEVPLFLWFTAAEQFIKLDTRNEAAHGSACVNSRNVYSQEGQGVTWQSMWYYFEMVASEMMYQTLRREIFEHDRHEHWPPLTPKFHAAKIRTRNNAAMYV